MLDEFRPNRSLAAEREAHRIGVKHELAAGGHAKGSRKLLTESPLGRSIVSGQAPKHARNSAGHSSTGSSTTWRPTLRTTTSLWSSGNRQSLGRRTAWLPPFLKSF